MGETTRRLRARANDLRDHIIAHYYDATINPKDPNLTEAIKRAPDRLIALGQENQTLRTAISTEDKYAADMEWLKNRELVGLGKQYTSTKRMLGATLACAVPTVLFALKNNLFNLVRS